jgi:hypothetical protein
MTTTFYPLKKGVAGQLIRFPVKSKATGNFQVAPTIALGDVTRSIDGVAFQNTDNLPTVTPAGGRIIQVVVSLAEANGEIVDYIASDVSNDEWDEVHIQAIFTVRPLEDLAFPNTTGYGIDVTNTGEVALDFNNIKAATAPTTLTNITVPAVTTTGAVSGDVAGKVLGGGVSIITGVGAWSLDGAGATIASAVDVVLTTAHGAGSWAGSTTAAIAAAVWAYVSRTLTQPAASVIAIVSGSTAITITRGDTYTETFTLPSDISDNDDIWFTYKNDKIDSDDDAIVLIKKSGLSRINKAAATIPANGSITTPTATTAVVTLQATEAAKLAPSLGCYDIQKRKGTNVTTVREGNCTVAADVTRAVV